jgi:hypothetical protein
MGRGVDLRMIYSCRASLNTREVYDLCLSYPEKEESFIKVYLWRKEGCETEEFPGLHSMHQRIVLFKSFTIQRTIRPL